MFNLKTILVAIVLAIVVTVSGTASASTPHRCGTVTRPGFVSGMVTIRVSEVRTTCKRARLVVKRGPKGGFGFKCFRPFGLDSTSGGTQNCIKGRAIVILKFPLVQPAYDASPCSWAGACPSSPPPHPVYTDMVTDWDCTAYATAAMGVDAGAAQGHIAETSPYPMSQTQAEAMAATGPEGYIASYATDVTCHPVANNPWVPASNPAPQPLPADQVVY